MVAQHRKHDGAVHLEPRSERMADASEKRFVFHAFAQVARSASALESGTCLIREQLRKARLNCAQPHASLPAVKSETAHKAAAIDKRRERDRRDALGGEQIGLTDRIETFCAEEPIGRRIAEQKPKRIAVDAAAAT